MQAYLKRVRNRKERGAAILEFAIALPIFIALLLLIFDAGLGYSASRSSSSSARSAARVGALAGATRTADYQVLQSLRAEFSGVLDENGGGAKSIVVYRSDPVNNPNGEPPEACKSGSSVVLKCNYYDASILASLTREQFTDATITLPTGDEICDPAAVDWAWCPLGREADDGKFLGVYIVSETDTTTGLGSDAFTLEDRAVFALYFPPEPVTLPTE